MTSGNDLHPDYAPGTWRLDASHSELSFTVRHLMISKVRGFFRSFDVTVVTGEDPADTTVEATIDVASVDTNNEGRDGHLRTSDFFLVDEYPTATFRSTAVTGTPQSFTVTGDLTLRGVTQQVVLAGELDGVLAGGDRTVAAVTATTTINRLDFGVNWNAALEAGGMTLGDEVALTLSLQLVKQS